MKYKYKKNQLFGKRLNVPEDIRQKIYDCILTFEEYVKYELDDKIPISCLCYSDWEIVKKIGVDKAKNLDWNLINKGIVSRDLFFNLLMSFDSSSYDKNIDLAVELINAFSALPNSNNSYYILPFFQKNPELFNNEGISKIKRISEKVSSYAFSYVIDFITSNPMFFDDKNIDLAVELINALSALPNPNKNSYYILPFFQKNPELFNNEGISKIKRISEKVSGYAFSYVIDFITSNPMFFDDKNIDLVIKLANAVSYNDIYSIFPFFTKNPEFFNNEGISKIKRIREKVLNLDISCVIDFIASNLMFFDDKNIDLIVELADTVSCSVFPFFTKNPELFNNEGISKIKRISEKVSRYDFFYVINFIASNPMFFDDKNIDLIVELADTVSDDSINSVFTFFTKNPEFFNNEGISKIKRISEKVSSYVFSYFAIYITSNPMFFDDKNIDLVVKLANTISIENIDMAFRLFINDPESFNNEWVERLEDVINEVQDCNSIELVGFEDIVITSLFNNDDWKDRFEKMARVFEKNHLPFYVKEYKAFEILYPDFQKKRYFTWDNEYTNDRLSPFLQKGASASKLFRTMRMSDTEARFQMLYDNLLRIAIQTNERSLREYIGYLEEGSTLFYAIKKGIINTSDLDDNKSEILESFSEYLMAIYENTKQGEGINTNGLNLLDKINYLSDKFTPTKKYELLDRIVRTTMGLSGIKTFNQLKDMMNNNFVEAQNRNREFGRKLESENFRLNEGDYIRGIGNIDAVDGSLEKGNVCKELLGSILGTSDSDTTPLDIDITRINANNYSSSQRNSSGLPSNIYHCIAGTATGFEFGNIYVMIDKDNPNFAVTRSYSSFGSNDGKKNKEEDIEYNPLKGELFMTSGDFHAGMLVGMPLTDIKCFIYKENKSINSSKPYNEDGTINYNDKKDCLYQDLPLLKMLCAKKGLYIPIVDFSGKLIFSEKEYLEIREKMAGLSRYDMAEKYKIEDGLLMFPGIEETIKEMEEDQLLQTEKKKKIKSSIQEVLMSPELELNLKVIANKVQSNLSSSVLELIEIGSTARGTNVPNDGDYDYMLKIGKKQLKEKSSRIIDTLKARFLKNGGADKSHSNRVKVTDVALDGLERVGKVSIDVSLDQKRSGFEYSTEMCLNDRLQTIEKMFPDKLKYVRANIVKAKQLLKSVGAYKPSRSDSSQGGIGGIGVETWILQNGGSLIKAISDFLGHAMLPDGKIKSFDQFKKDYQIWDFGMNHEPREKYINDRGKVVIPYDNFVADNMNENGYKKMVQALQKYLISLNNSQTQAQENAGPSR